MLVFYSNPFISFILYIYVREFILRNCSILGLLRLSCLCFLFFTIISNSLIDHPLPISIFFIKSSLLISILRKYSLIRSVHKNSSTSWMLKSISNFSTSNLSMIESRKLIESMFCDKIWREKTNWYNFNKYKSFFLAFELLFPVPGQIF